MITDLDNLDKVKAATTNAGATALLAFQAGQDLARAEANTTGTVHYADEAKKGSPFLIRTDGTLVPIEGHLPAPTAIRGRVEFHDGASFSEYVNRFKDAGTTVFADRTKLAFAAVLDYHVAHPTDSDPTEPRWGRHRAGYAIQLTDEWKEWAGANGKEMNQLAFSSWFEDRIPDILEPAGAVIVELSRSFEAKKDVQFSGRINPDVGSVSLLYTEDVSGVPREGSIMLPRTFKLSIEPFQGAEKVTIDARIRFRVTDGKVMLRYELVRYKHVLEDAFNEELADITAQLGEGTVILAGTEPPAL